VPLNKGLNGYPIPNPNGWILALSALSVRPEHLATVCSETFGDEMITKISLFAMKCNELLLMHA